MTNKPEEVRCLDIETGKVEKLLVRIKKREQEQSDKK